MTNLHSIFVFNQPKFSLFINFIMAFISNMKLDMFLGGMILNNVMFVVE